MSNNRKRFTEYGLRSFSLILLFHLVTGAYSIAQSSNLSVKDTVHRHIKIPDSIRYKQEDAMDIITGITKLRHKETVDSENLIPGKIFASVFPAAGYSLSNGLSFVVASNFSFYTNNPNKTNLSVISLNPLYSLKQQTIVPLISSIWLKGNKINLLGDYRFYQYPSLTYGLGHGLGGKRLSQVDSVNYSYIKISQEALYKITYDIYGGIGYNLDYHYNIQEIGDDPQYDLYNDGATKTVSSGWMARLKYDSRVNSNNPKDASYVNLVFRDNLTALGSTNSWREIQVEIRKYITLSKHPSNVLAFWSWNEFTNGSVPYFDLPSTGWDDYSNSGRGYIQGRFRGTDILYDEAEYRFDILRNGLFGGVVFCNAESVPDYPFNSFDVIHVGKGIGLRIKLNKYSDTNLCIDYGWGDGGSRGFFFNVGEVF